MCMCYYPESGGCHRYAVVNQKYCVYCLGEETNWACQCKCVGCPTSHEAAVATKVEALTCAVSSRGQPDGAVAVEKDSDMSIQERVDRRNTAWWLERKAKEQAKEQARLEQMRLGATSAFATSALIVVQPAPFSTLQEDTSAVSVVQPAPFSILQEHTQ